MSILRSSNSRQDFVQSGVSSRPLDSPASVVSCLVNGIYSTVETSQVNVLEVIQPVRTSLPQSFLCFNMLRDLRT